MEKKVSTNGVFNQTALPLFSKEKAAKGLFDSTYISLISSVGFFGVALWNQRH